MRYHEDFTEFYNQDKFLLVFFLVFLVRYKLHLTQLVSETEMYCIKLLLCGF